MTENNIRQFVIIENFINQTIQNNLQKLKDSFTPFIGKKIITKTDSYVAGYKKPDIQISITEELKSIGIYRIDFNVRKENPSSRYIRIEFNFNMYSEDSCILKQYNNPYAGSYIRRSVLSLDIIENILQDIKVSNKFELLNADEVISNFNNAVLKCKEAEEAKNKVVNNLRCFVK